MVRGFAMMTAVRFMWPAKGARGPGGYRRVPSREMALRPCLEHLEARRLLAIGMVVGPDINISQLADNQAEGTIAINPKNPNQMFAASVSWPTPVIFGAYTTNARAANQNTVVWTGRTVGNGATGGDSLPNSFGDPSATFDNFGNLFLTYLTPTNGVLQSGTAAANNGVAADRILNDGDPTRNWAPGEWTGWTVNITAGTGVGESQTIASNTKNQLKVTANWVTVPDATSTYQIVAPNKTIAVVMSTDGGKTFAWIATLGTSGGTLDQPSIATGPGGTAAAGSVWLTYRNNDNFIYAAGAPVTGLGAVGKFIAPQKSLGSLGDNFGDIQVGPKGQVAIDYQSDTAPPNQATIFVDTDPSGLGAGPGFVGAVAVTTTFMGNNNPVQASPQRMPDAEANMAWDRSGSFGNANNGRLYIAFTNAPTFVTPDGTPGNKDTDIDEVYSDDGGKTWSAPPGSMTRPRWTTAAASSSPTSRSTRPRATWRSPGTTRRTTR